VRAELDDPISCASLVATRTSSRVGHHGQPAVIVGIGHVAVTLRKVVQL
jgi:hypothetical protein